jgi:crotonobetainyl-CoA:carnitine CoA-transferase CaiB-like acyl-CoA transferase
VLSAYRVLDLTDERGHLTGAILASLGAEVIHVEPPGGSTARRLGPFAGGAEHPERSLHHWAYNRGKQSVVLDLGDPADRQRLLDLADGADFLVESADPGTMDALGLGHDTLAQRNPALIHVSITAFGSDGPKADHRATDLTIAAAAGQLALSGDSDRPPLRIPLPQAYHHAAAEAAGAALTALYERQHRSGLGQHIDVSAQQALLQATQSMVLAHPLEASIPGRFAGGITSSGVPIQLRWPCKDGFVSITFLFGAAFQPFTQRLMDWVHEEGHCDEATRSKDWEAYGAVLLGDPAEVPEYQRICGTITSLLATKTKDELLTQALERRVLLSPVTTIEEVLTSPQFAARDFWHDVHHEGHGTVRYPGAFAKFSATPLPDLPAAPALGAHTEVVLAQQRRQPTVPIAEPVPSTEPPLTGLKVLDLQWVMAGPAATRVLADQGAQVVRVESVHKLDTARTLQPFRRDEPDPECSGLFGNMNAGKLGLALDLSKPGAREVVLDLVEWADVVCESFSPRGMAGLGLEYDVLRQRKPDLIMTSSCLMGQYGPHALLSGFGNMAAAISGFYNVVGWPDRAPAGPFGAYTDYVSPRYLVAAILAAVEHRRQTGEGQYIDLSQAEATMQFLAPALLDYGVNGHVMERCGNDDPVFAPHGVYPAAGDDQWVAVACTSDEEWRALCKVLGEDERAGWSAAQRLDRRRELDDLLAGWTADRSPLAAQEQLQAAGVPAHQVQNSAEVFTDPQLAHRGHFNEVAHDRQGTTWVEGCRFRMSRTPPSIDRGAPTIGQDTFAILTEVLGYDVDRVAELAIAELLE